MQSWAERQAQSELHNPLSPYFLGKPSVPEQINQFLSGRCRVNTAGYYNTNYFGKGAKGLLARPTNDSVEINGVVKERNRFNKTMALIGSACAVTVGAFLVRKIPGSQYIPQVAWKGVKLLGTGLGYLLKGIGWIFKK